MRKCRRSWTVIRAAVLQGLDKGEGGSAAGAGAAATGQAARAAGAAADYSGETELIEDASDPVPAPVPAPKPALDSAAILA